MYFDRAQASSTSPTPGGHPLAAITFTFEDDKIVRVLIARLKPADEVSARRPGVRIQVHSFRSLEPRANGITGGIMVGMAMTLRLSDDEAEALRRRAELESRSMQEVARQAIREYVESHSRTDLLDRVLDQELPRYAEALRRLGE